MKHGFLVLFGAASLIAQLMVPAPSQAGCGNSPATAWQVDLSTGKAFGYTQGEVTECGNKSGSFQSFKGKGLDFGWAECIDNCESGFMPGSTYVRVKTVFKPGSVERSEGRSKSCVQQIRSTTMYCFKSKY
jgi:hypothetical protein